MDFNSMIFITLLASAITDALIFVCLIFVLGVLWKKLKAFFLICWQTYWGPLPYLWE
jgi:hypothetical protein